MFSHPDADDHELVQFIRDPGSGLRAIIALHSTALGPAFGGCRMWPYADEAAALVDALRLSRGMTYKAAIMALPYGGGKTVVIGDPACDKSPALLRALAAAVERLQGRYIIADDVGTTIEDLAVMREVTSHTAAATRAARSPLAVTAHGVFEAIQAAVRHRWSQNDLSGLEVAVQGLGNVGMPLCDHLRRAGAKLVVADPDAKRTEEAARRFDATTVAADAILTQPVDVLAPCALGGVFDDQTIPLLQVTLVAGGANNQLQHARHAEALADHGILYVPDYIANAGGVIDFDQEQRDDRPESVLAAVDRIHDVVLDILQRAEKAGSTPLAVADGLVRERLEAARAACGG
ncbi:MAG: Glu/Leu/Phe/Val dehydrogenase dimerization domain-containing protein [Pseudomonadota bacterium]